MPFSRSEHVRRAIAGTALGLFLAGSNYCLVGTLVASVAPESRVACMSPASPSGGSCHEAPAATHCGGAPASSPDAAPVRTGTPPCCVALAPVLSVQAFKIADHETATPPAILPAGDESAPLLRRGPALAATRVHGPPPPDPRASLAARAPPLA